MSKNCPSTKGISTLQTNQRAIDIKQILCLHSKALSHLVQNWRELLDQNNETSNIEILSEANNNKSEKLVVAVIHRQYYKNSCNPFKWIKSY